MPKKGRRYFSPMIFNLVAVVWILAAMPLAVAFVSNAGADGSNEEYQQLTKDPVCVYFNDCTHAIYGGTFFSNYTGKDLSWYNNGKDMSWYYRTVNPDLNILDLDCVYIKDGYCQGNGEPSPSDYGMDNWNDCDTNTLFFPPTSYSLSNDILWNCEFADIDYTYTIFTNFYHWQFSYDGSWFYRGSDSHSYVFEDANVSNITDSSYAGDSGNTFSFRLNERMMNQLVQGEMVDALRFTVFDYPSAPAGTPTSYNCNNFAPLANLTIDTKITQFYDGKEQEIGAYTTTTDNKFFMEAQPLVFSAGCYIGWEVVVDFNGLDTRSMFNFVDQGKWNESTMVIEWTFTRNDGLPLGSTNVGINGMDDFIIAIDYSLIEAQQVEFQTNVGLLTLGATNIILAMASTPYWDPFKNFFKGRF